MRTLKLLVILAALAALTVPAGALTFRQAYTGPVTLKFASWDMGVVYAVPGSLVDTIAGVNTYEGIAGNAALYPMANGHYYDSNGKRDDEVGYDASLREDGWGILTVTEIYKTGTSASNPANILWLPGDNGNTELTAIFVGGVDNALVASTDTIGAEVIQTQGIELFLYENTVASLDPSLGANGRTGFASYTGITGGTLCLDMLVTTGVGQISGSTGPAEFRAIFTPDVGGATGSGSFASYVDLVPGTRDYDQFNTNGMLGGTDLSVNGTTTANTDFAQNGNWTVLNEDPFRGNVIPEPITMLGVVLGIGGLAGYIRKRRLS